MRGVSLTQPVLAFFFLIWGVSLTHPMLVLLFIAGVPLTHLLLASFLSGVCLLHIPRWLHFYAGSLSCWFLEFHIPCWVFVVVVVFVLGVSLTHPVLFFSSLFFRRSFSYTSRSSFIFVRGVSLTHPVLPSFFCGGFLLHIPSWLHFYLGSFSCTSRAFLFLSGEFLLHIPCWLFLCVELLWYAVFSEDNPWRKEPGGRWPRLKKKKRKKSEKVTLKTEKEPYNTLYRAEQNRTKTGAGFFMLKFFLTCPMLACSCWEFMLHLLCWLLDVGSFCYTSCAWCFMWWVSLTHPLLASLRGKFLLHILCRLTYVGSSSYTSCAGFVWGVSLTQPVLASLCGEFLLQVLC